MNLQNFCKVRVFSQLIYLCYWMSSLTLNGCLLAHVLFAFHYHLNLVFVGFPARRVARVTAETSRLFSGITGHWSQSCWLSIIIIKH